MSYTHCTVRKIIELKKRGHGMLLSTMVFWGLLLGMISFVDPESVADWPINQGYFIPGIIFFVSLLLLIKLIFNRFWLSLWWTGGIILFVYLRIYKLGNVVNGLLLFGVLICGQIYSYIKEEGNLIKQTDANIGKKNEQDVGGTD